MSDTLDWNTIHERLEHVLPHGLDETTWQALQRHSLPFVADELLWRVEALARQVPAQGPIFLRPIARTDRIPRRPVIAPDPVSEPCALCDDQPGRGIGKRCALCVAAIRLVLGFPLLLDDAGMITGGEKDAPDHQDEPEVSNLFEL